MSALVLRKFLLDGGTTQELFDRFAIKNRRHETHRNLVLFKYDQIQSPFAEPIVREARGIVLDEADEWRVVARAFDKFFNHGEGHAAAIDWSTARVQEKLDGSLCTLYFYADEWHVATTGTPDASGEVPDGASSKRFADYFWETFRAQGGFLEEASRRLSYSFELMGPLNRIVVVHPKAHLRLLSVRDPATGEQFAPEAFADVLGIPAVRSFSLFGFAALEESFGGMSPLTQEGYVVVDAAFNRVKVKNPAYVALHHAKDGMTDRAFVEIARSGETSEVEIAFPELAAPLQEMRAKYQALLEELEASYQAIADIPEQKAFAFEAVKTRCPGAMFQRRKGTPIAEYLKGLHVDRVHDLLKTQALPTMEAA